MTNLTEHLNQKWIDPPWVRWKIWSMTEIMKATDDDNDDCDDDTEAAPAVMGQETVKSSSRTYSQQNTTISRHTVLL